MDGVLLDEFVVQQLSELSDENSERFRRILEIKIEEVLEQSQTVQEHNLIKKKRDKLKADIAAQTRNLREADGSIKQFIQEDLQNLAEELRETERQLSKLDEGRKNNMIAIISVINNAYTIFNWKALKEIITNKIGIKAISQFGFSFVSSSFST